MRDQNAALDSGPCDRGARRAAARGRGAAAVDGARAVDVGDRRGGSRRGGCIPVRARRVRGRPPRAEPARPLDGRRPRRRARRGALPTERGSAVAHRREQPHRGHEAAPGARRGHGPRGHPDDHGRANAPGPRRRSSRSSAWRARLAESERLAPRGHHPSQCPGHAPPRPPGDRQPTRDPRGPARFVTRSELDRVPRLPRCPRPPAAGDERRARARAPASGSTPTASGAASA